MLQLLFVRHLASVFVLFLSSRGCLAKMAASAKFSGGTEQKHGPGISWSALNSPCSFFSRFNHVSIELNNDTTWTQTYLLSILISDESSFLRSTLPPAAIMEGETRPSEFRPQPSFSTSVTVSVNDCPSAASPPRLVTALRGTRGRAGSELFLPLDPC